MYTEIESGTFRLRRKKFNDQIFTVVERSLLLPDISLPSLGNLDFLWFSTRQTSTVITSLNLIFGVLRLRRHKNLTIETEGELLS